MDLDGTPCYELFSQNTADLVPSLRLSLEWKKERKREEEKERARGRGGLSETREGII